MDTESKRPKSGAAAHLGAKESGEGQGYLDGQLLIAMPNWNTCER